MRFVTLAIVVDLCVSFGAIRVVKFERLQSLDFEQFEGDGHIRYHRRPKDGSSSKYHDLDGVFLCVPDSLLGQP